MTASSRPERPALERRWLVAAGVGLVFVVGGAQARALDPVRVALASVTPDATAGAAPRALAACGEGTAPDGNACVHLVPNADEGAFAPAVANVHHEKSGRLTQYEQIPRLPDRPADYDLYRYPIPAGLPGGHFVVSGYDLDRPDEQQRRGRKLSHVGHGGLDLPQTKGTPVKLVALEHQEGPAEVLYTGHLFGTTVLTRHTLREGGRDRDYLVLFGHLDSIAAGVAAGVTMPEGALVGAVGDTGSPELVHLHLEVRRVREGVDLARVPAGAPLIAESISTVCDPRNVLPLK